ncbi:MAG: hypothetical protein NTU63_00185 [Candidatus Pacearchaeota archaeon]|nr:hypothetical protein [Candidatus Pacearchaeota archaeon]
MRKHKVKKRALSPVVTTVLLIALVVVIALIIFLWFKGMVQEGVIKFGKNIKLVCDDVQFEASCSGGILSVLNSGNVPIFRIKLKIEGTGGSYETKDITETSASSSWPSNGLNQGGTFSGDISSETSGATKLIVLPMLMGTSNSGHKTFMCEGQYGEEVYL